MSQIVINKNLKTGNSDEAFHCRQNELSRKNIDLQVLKALLQANIETIEQKRKLLKDENNILDALHFKVWELQSCICDNVQNFATKHDFSVLIKNYPSIPDEFIYNCDCEDRSYKVCERVAEFEILSQEIQKLESNLENEGCTFLRNDLIEAEIELQKCTAEIPEVSRLKSSINESKDRVNNLKAKLKMRIADKNNRAMHSRTYDSPDSSIPVTYPENVSFQPPGPKASKWKKNVSKRKLEPKEKCLDSDEHHFVKAATYLNNSKNSSQFKNTPSCEKIIAEAVSNEELSSNRPKKKFVMKTRSSITQRRSIEN